MTDQHKLLYGFGLYVEPVQGTSGLDHNTIGTPPGTRLMRIERLPRGWRLWLATRDFKYGTYLEMFDDGRILHCTTRVDEGDEYYWVRPSDDMIRGEAAKASLANKPTLANKPITDSPTEDKP